MQYASLIVRDIYSKGYINMVNKAPAVLGWLYDAYDKPWKYESRRMAFDRLNTLPLSRLIVDYAPDIIVSTHFFRPSSCHGCSAANAFAPAMQLSSPTSMHMRCG